MNYRFEILDFGFYPNYLPAFFIFIAAVIWFYKRSTLKGITKTKKKLFLYLLPFVILILGYLEISNVLQFRQNVNNYESGNYMVLRGNIDSIEEYAWSIENINIEGMSFEIKSNNNGCYGELSRSNKLLTIKNRVTVNFLANGCIVYLEIKDK